MGLFLKTFEPWNFCFEKFARDFPKGKSHDFKSYVINKGLIGVVTAYVTYELGAAVWKAGEGQLEDGQAGVPESSRKVPKGRLRGSPPQYLAAGIWWSIVFFWIVALVAVACFLWFLRSFN